MYIQGTYIYADTFKLAHMKSKEKENMFGIICEVEDEINRI